MRRISTILLCVMLLVLGVHGFGQTTIESTEIQVPSFAAYFCFDDAQHLVTTIKIVNPNPFAVKVSENIVGNPLSAVFKIGAYSAVVRAPRLIYQPKGEGMVLYRYENQITPVKPLPIRGNVSIFEVDKVSSEKLPYITGPTAPWLVASVANSPYSAHGMMQFDYYFDRGTDLILLNMNKFSVVAVIHLISDSGSFLPPIKIKLPAYGTFRKPVSSLLPFDCLHWSGHVVVNTISPSAVSIPVSGFMASMKWGKELVGLDALTNVQFKFPPIEEEK